MDSKRSNCKILMFPWLAHGHVFPFLELAKRILKKKSFHIYLCTTSIHFNSINQFIQKNILHEYIEVVELNLDPNPLLPPHYHTTKNLTQHLVPTLLKSFQTSRSSFFEIVCSINPNLIIFDAFQQWVPSLGSSLGIPSVHFSVVGAAATSYGYHQYNCWDDNFPFKELSLNHHEKKSLDDLIKFLHSNVFEEEKDSFFLNFMLSHEIVLVKTSKALEGKYVDYVSSFANKRILAVGPLVTDDKDEDAEDSSEILQWLSKKTPNSTVYVSFGSECFLSQEEMEEVAKGLELCEVDFIWVVRFPDTEKKVIEEVLPVGFLDRVKDRGIIISGWAPQANILRHRNVGGFVSHCGWSSINESVYYGVPIIAMPMKINMFIDAKMLVDVGVCEEVRRDGNGVIKGEEIVKAINKVIVENSGEAIRNRVQELSEMMRREEDGTIEETSEILWQLCRTNEKKENVSFNVLDRLTYKTSLQEDY